MTNPTLPAPPSEELVARLRGRLAMATQGEWQLQDGCSWRRIGTQFHDGDVLCPTTYSARDNHPDLTAGKGESLYANLTLIVEAVNALPSLLDHIERQAAAIAAMQPEGWVLVPRVPTEGMLDQGVAVLDAPDDVYVSPDRVWAAMIADAPQNIRNSDLLPIAAATSGKEGGHGPSA